MGTLQLPFPNEQFWKDRIERISVGSVALVAEVNGSVVGYAAVRCNINSHRRKHAGELDITVHSSHFRIGVGSKLLSAIVELADRWLNLSRLELTAFADNEAAIGLYKKAGFEVEGKLRKYAFRNGELADVCYMARVSN